MPSDLGPFHRSFGRVVACWLSLSLAGTAQALSVDPTPAPTPTPTPAPGTPSPAPSSAPEKTNAETEKPGAKPTAPETEKASPGEKGASSTAPAPGVPPAKPDPTEVPTPSGQLETVLVLKDGTQVVGRLVAMDDQMYTMMIAGVPTKFSKENVLRVVAQPPIEERYKQMRAAIDDSDLDRRALVAEWLRDRKRYDLALAEADSILKVDPLHPRTKELKKSIELQIDIDKASADRKAREAAKETGRPAGDGEAEGDEGGKETELSRPFQTLSEEQINLIRVYEIDLQNPPRLLIPRELIAQLLTHYADDPLLPSTPEGREKLYQARPSQILDLMYRLKAKDLYGQVRVLEDPVTFAAFKRDVHQGWLMNACASNRCHGGEQAGRLMLKRSRPTDASTYYTNFLILDRFRLADGRPLINYEEPEKSPLVQMAMPRNLTARPHPMVRNQAGMDQWKPGIRSTDDRRYRATLDWIRSMYRPRPDYGVTYDPPTPKDVLPPVRPGNGER
ncbi:MAG: hypothetical protein U0570_00165 [Phycisphaerales bacterium]